MTRALSFMAGLAILGTAAPARPAVVTNEIVIRVYDSFGLPSAARATAIQGASDILTQASLEVVWRDCSGVVAALPRACRKAPGATELVVRLVRVRPGVTELVLGESIIDSTTGRGTLATIYADRVDTMALAARTPRMLTLGRVMAHEIGHLLLGTPGHSTTGLMRRLSSTADLQVNRREEWLFTASQRDQLAAVFLEGGRLEWMVGARGFAPGASGAARRLKTSPRG